MTRQQIESQLRADNPTTTDDAGERHYPGSDVYEAAIQRWADAMEADQVPPDRKTWPDAKAFLQEFGLDEMALISLSTNPIIAALRFLLSTWLGEVWSDDERVEMGLDALVSEGIIDEDRRDEIVSTTTP